LIYVLFRTRVSATLQPNITLFTA